MKNTGVVLYASAKSWRNTPLWNWFAKNTEFTEGLATISYTKQRVNTQNSVVRKEPKNVVDSVVDSVVKNVVDSENKVVSFIKKDPFISAKQLAIKLKTTERTVQRYIQKLQQKGMLTRKGPAKGGHWEIIENES